ACLGKFYYVTDRDSGAKQKVESGEFDSTVGDRAKAAKTYREVVVYDPDQIYPGYVILYDRLDGGKTVTANDAPFHLELPAAGIENMDFALNELLLWHGTDEESATAIAESGFLSGSAGTEKHGRRFGEGAYFAEDLAKNIGCAPESLA
ncbi:unnamed protein product, partial [Polarella glacialis]